jgi:hypothetical protein
MKKNNPVSKSPIKASNLSFHIGNSPAVSPNYAQASKVAERAAQKAISAKPKKFKSGGW